MDSDRLNRWLTLFANFAVVAGIVILAIEVRQNNTLLEAEARSNRTRNVQAFNDKMMDPALADLVVRARVPEELSESELLRYGRLQRWVFITWESEYLDYASGLTEDINIAGYANTFRWMPGLRREWESVKQRRTPEFVAFMDREVIPKVNAE